MKLIEPLVGLEAATSAVLGILNPNDTPIFEWGHETTPTAEQMRDLSREIAEAVIRALQSKLEAAGDWQTE